MRVYCDTNILIYATASQGDDKKSKSISVFDKYDVAISPLSLQEFIYATARLGIDKSIIEKDIEFYSEFSIESISKELLLESFKLCKEIDYCRNINDIIHLKLAELYCSKLVTFDKDFNKLQQHSKIEIEIL